MQLKMENLCRVCLEEGASEGLFSISDSSLRYYEIISAWTGISIMEDDGMPQRICVTCICEITRLNEFRSKCLKSDTLLRNMLQDDNINRLEEYQRLPIHRKTNENSKINRKQKRPKHLQKKDHQSDSPTFLQEYIQNDDDDDVANWSSYDFDASHFVSVECLNKDSDIPQKTKRAPIAIAFSCRKCELNFLSWKELADHNNKHVTTTQEKSLSCRYCGQEFALKGNMFSHIKQAHSDVQRFQCGYCGEKFKEFKQLRRHLTLHRPGDAVIDITVSKENDDKTEERNTAIKQELHIKPEVSDNFKSKESCPPSLEADILESNSVASERNQDLPVCNDGHLIEEHETKNICGNIRSSEENSTSFDKSVIIDNEKSAVVKEVQNQSNMAAVSNSPMVLASDSPKTIDKREILKSHDLAEPPLKKTKKDLVLKEEALHCNMCGKRFKFKSSLKRHEASHDPDKPYHCMMGRCRWSFATESELTFHMKVNHREGGDYRCDLCEKVFAHRDNLRHHMSQHRSPKKHICSYCNKVFASLTTHKIHVRLHTKDLPFVCEVCEAAFATKDRLKNHTLTHTGVRAFTCDLCNKDFVTGSSLNHHKKKHTGAHLKTCTECGKTFSKGCKLTLHMQKKHKNITAETKNVACEICGINLPKAELDQHLKIHTTQYKCTVCFKTFPLTSLLEAHIKTHSVGYRSHVCGKCGSSFDKAGYLRGHMAKCYGDCPSLSCPYCPNKYASTRGFASHMRTHTGEKAVKPKSVLKKTSSESCPDTATSGLQTNNALPSTGPTTVSQTPDIVHDIPITDDDDDV